MQSKRLGLAILALALLAAFTPAAKAEPADRIPIVYSTDLLHPHDDPDDHYDLATLFAMEEFDIRGILLDLGERQKTRMGRPPVEQMIKITGRKAAYAVGLDRGLQSSTDTATGGPADSQGGIELLLSALRESDCPVVLFATGSCRDAAAAFNREPDLMKKKVRALYINAGNGPEGPQWEYNVRLDEKAYFRLFESSLPLYWCPCWGNEPGKPEAVLGWKSCATYYVVDQPQVVGACEPRVRNYFVYCLTRSPADPVAFLDSGPQALPTGKRNMWCTAAFFHAAGREIYQRGPQDFVALPPSEAVREGIQGRKVTPYRFVAGRAERKDPPVRETRAGATDGTTANGGRADSQPPAAAIQWKSDANEPNARLFHVTDEHYPEILASALKNLLTGLGR